MRCLAASVGLLLSFALAGCSSEVADTANTDPSKLSEGLEKRAEQIEQKAYMAVAAAEREAAAELELLRAEAAEGDDEEAASTAEEVNSQAR
jgi:hypothetical protein